MKKVRVKCCITKGSEEASTMAQIPAPTGGALNFAGYKKIPAINSSGIICTIQRQTTVKGAGNIPVINPMPVAAFDLAVIAADWKSQSLPG